MSPLVTAKQILQHPSLYDLERVSFQTPDDLPTTAVFIDTDTTRGAGISFSDRPIEESHQ